MQRKNERCGKKNQCASIVEIENVENGARKNRQKASIDKIQKIKVMKAVENQVVNMLSDKSRVYKKPYSVRTTPEAAGLGGVGGGTMVALP